MMVLSGGSIVCITVAVMLRGLKGRMKSAAITTGVMWCEYSYGGRELQEVPGLAAPES